MRRILVFGRIDKAEARLGKVDAVVLEGLDLWFNSSDHLPPHLHARRRGEWEIRVYFLLCTDDELAFDMGTESKQGSMNETKASAQELILLMHDRDTEGVVSDRRRFRVLHRPNRQIAEHGRNIFVLIPASELPDVAEFVSIVNRRHQLRGLLVRDDVQPSSIPQMFERAGLRMVRNTIVYSDPGIPRRVLAAWPQNAQEQLIAKASVSKDRLFVLSCALQPYEVAFDSMPALKRIPMSERANFTVDEDGSYIHWPGPDIHLDLDAIRAAIDPEARGRAEAARALHDNRYGAAISKVRLRMGLKQSEIKGLSERQVRRIEKGEGTTYEALRRLAAAHRMDLESYLRELAVNASDPALERAIA